MNAIHIAYEGLTDKLRAIHGSPEDNPGSPRDAQPRRSGRVLPQHAGDTPRRLTPEAFDAAFGRPKKTIVIPSPFKKGRS